jgi:hypothetical protein
MSDCRLLSDRMPAVALGRSTWDPQEIDHLAACSSCRSEWNLVRLSSGLGRYIGAELDARTISRAVLDRVNSSREDARARRGAWGFAGLAAAAAAAVVLWTGSPASRPPVTAAAAPVTALRTPLPELDNLSAGELDAILQTIDEPYWDSAADTSAPGDLDDEALDGGIDTWEG